MKKLFAAVLFLALLVFGVSFAFSQEHGAQPATSSGQHGTNPETQKSSGNPNEAIDQELTETSKEAATGRDHGEPEAEDEGHGQFLHSPTVAKLGHLLGVDVRTARWIFFALNFLIIAGLIYWFSRSSVPAMFRNRTATIQKGIEEARRASEDANNRLRDVESRLAKLDAEVAQLRNSAEADFAVEEQRIKEQAELDARRVVETAEQEIAAAAKNARRELTAYAAELAVDMAGKKIQVSDAADQALVRNFVSQLGTTPAGKDGK